RRDSVAGLRLLGAVLVIAALSLVAACGGSSAGGPKGSKTAYKVGIVQFAGSDPYASSIMRGIQQYAEGQGWDANLVDSGGDVSKALTAMTNLVQQKVDVIVTATYPPAQLQGGIAQAKAAGIPVVSVIGAGNVPGLAA